MSSSDYRHPVLADTARRQHLIGRADIDYDDIKIDIRAYLGDDAEVHCENIIDMFGRSVDVYKVTSYQALTSQHVDRLRADSARRRSERRREQREATRSTESRSRARRPNRSSHATHHGNTGVGVDEAPGDPTYTYGDSAYGDSHTVYSRPSSPTAHDWSNIRPARPEQGHEVYDERENRDNEEVDGNYPVDQAEGGEYASNYRVYPTATAGDGYINSPQPTDSNAYEYQRSYELPPHTHSNPRRSRHIPTNSTQPVDPSPQGYGYRYDGSAQFTTTSAYGRYSGADPTQPAVLNPQGYREMSTDQGAYGFYTREISPVQAEQDDEDYRRRLARDRRRLNHNQDRFNRP